MVTLIGSSFLVTVLPSLSLPLSYILGEGSYARAHYILAPCATCQSEYVFARVAYVMLTAVKRIFSPMSRFLLMSSLSLFIQWVLVVMKLTFL